MQPQRSARKTADGLTLALYDWRVATGGARGVVLLHGLGEHAVRHARLARGFQDSGWAVRAFDWRGHGHSDGARGDVPHGAALLDDAKLVIDDFAQELGAAPLLFGHSMGGLFAARLACTSSVPLAGLLLSSPALAVNLSPLQKLLLHTLTRLAPGWGAPNGLQSRYLSHDQAVVDAYDKDPLVHRVISARLLQAMRTAIDYTQQHAGQLALPVLLQIAGDDRIVDKNGSLQFYSRLRSGIGTLHDYPDCYHEIFNESSERSSRALDDLQQWLQFFSEGNFQPAASRPDRISPVGG